MFSYYSSMYPQLIENSTKTFLANTLQQCHANRVNVYYYCFNIGVVVLFVFIVGITLYYCNKEKLSDYGKHQKMLTDQHAIMEKIRYFQTENKMQNESRYSSISNLPFIQA